MFKIIKDRSIPVDKGRQEWPWVLMDVGDCAIIDDPSLLKKAQAACHVYGGKTGKKFRTKTEADHLKVWRVK